MRVPSLFLLLLALATRLAAYEEADLNDAGGKPVLHYAIVVPKDPPPAHSGDPARQLGLILCFHEHDGHAQDELPSVTESLARLQLTEQFVVIGVGGPERAYTQEDRSHTVELIAWARKAYAINPRRVYTWGRGEGATMSAEFALAHPELVTTAITYSWGFTAMPDGKDPFNELPGLYIVIGLSDIDYHVTTVQDAYQRARPHGYQIIYREVKGLGSDTHDPPTNDDALVWANAMRNKVQPLAPKELALLKPIASAGAARSLVASAAVIDGIALVGGLQAGALIGPLFDAKDEPTRLLAIASAERSAYGEQAMVALAKKLKDPSPVVRKAVISALGVNAHWHSVVAQQALSQYATAKKGDVEDRGLAIAAIGKALVLQIPSSHLQDIVLGQSLVMLLDDENEAIRTQAFAILQPAQASDYKPEASKAERKVAIAAWQAWLTAAAAKEPDIRAATAKPRSH